MATNRVLPKHFFDYFREKKTERCLSRLVCSADGVGTSANEKRALWPRRNEAAAVRNRQKNKPAVTLWVALNQRSAAPSGRVTDPMSWFISFRVGGCLLFCCSFEFIRFYIFLVDFFCWRSRRLRPLARTVVTRAADAAADLISRPSFPAATQGRSRSNKKILASKLELTEFPSRR